MRRSGSAEIDPFSATVVDDEGSSTNADAGDLTVPAVGLAANRRQFLISTASVIGGFALWELLVRFFEINPLILVPPSAIAIAFVEMLGSGVLWHNIGVSAQQFGLGYGIASSIGVVLGLAMGQNQVDPGYLNPWVTALYATPSISLAPLILVWLGFGIFAKALVVALLCFFPVVLNSLAGADNLRQEWKDVARAYSANRREYFFKIVAPGSVPYIFTGLRLAVGRGLVGIVAADLFGADEGLGFLLLRSARNFRTADIFVIAIIFAVFGVLLTMALTATERMISPWKKE